MHQQALPKSVLESSQQLFEQGIILGAPHTLLQIAIPFLLLHERHKLCIRFEQH